MSLEISNKQLNALKISCDNDLKRCDSNFWCLCHLLPSFIFQILFKFLKISISISKVWNVYENLEIILQILKVGDDIFLNKWKSLRVFFII